MASCRATPHSQWRDRAGFTLPQYMAGHTSFPYIQGRPVRLITLDYPYWPLSPPFKLVTHSTAAKIRLTSAPQHKSPNPPRKT
ncbi:protein of unknown function [Candidatus Methylomirabilis oxygeniifera]|uniref:Uncharacterized protein n=1 Tax=Methylomirabilis oxygeniifera TaxID=671143 RepID=D5MHA3_METO1|nr:protein of unknown function [Candidatus Methylomirabilis oxyfera]